MQYIWQPERVKKWLYTCKIYILYVEWYNINYVKFEKLKFYFVIPLLERYIPKKIGWTKINSQKHSGIPKEGKKRGIEEKNRGESHHILEKW